MLRAAPPLVASPWVRARTAPHALSWRILLLQVDWEHRYGTSSIVISNPASTFVSSSVSCFLPRPKLYYACRVDLPVLRRKPLRFLHNHLRIRPYLGDKSYWSVAFVSPSVDCGLWSASMSWSWTAPDLQGSRLYPERPWSSKYGRDHPSSEDNHRPYVCRMTPSNLVHSPTNAQYACYDDRGRWELIDLSFCSYVGGCASLRPCWLVWIRNMWGMWIAFVVYVVIRRCEVWGEWNMELSNMRAWRGWKMEGSDMEVWGDRKFGV